MYFTLDSPDVASGYQKKFPSDLIDPKLIINSECFISNRYVVDCQRVTDIMLKALSSLRHLVVLNLADCVRLSDSGVRQMVEGPSGSKIREMNLTNCVRVSDVSLLRVAQRYTVIPNLSYFLLELYICIKIASYVI